MFVEQLENSNDNLLDKVAYAEDEAYNQYKKNDLLRRTYCGGCETSRYMSPIAARFGPAAEHGSIAAG